jgi:tetratricopeptide (TPR) repeat protein
VFSNLQAFYDQHCLAKPQSKECLIALYHYRAALTDFYTQKLAISEISDPQVLFDKMLANRTTAPQKSLEAAQRLTELEPHLYEAYKMEILQSLFIASQNPEKPDLDWNRLDLVLEKARELKGQDPELVEAVLLSEIFRNSDPRSLQDRARQLSEDYPQEWRGPYYLAWGLFNEGRGQEALDALMEAKRRDPKNQRIDQTLEGLQNGKAKPFESGLSFSDLNLVTN